MKRFFLISIFYFVSYIINANTNDTLVSKKVFYNIDLGISTGLYRLKYYDYNTNSINERIKRYYNDYYMYPSLGVSIKYKNIKFNTDYFYPKIVRLNVGYNFAKLMKLPPYQNINFKLSYAFQNPFYAIVINYNRASNYPFTTSLFGLELNYQYKKFEFYYTLLKYRRFVALDAKEHQHLLGVKYNIFKEKE